MEASVEEEVFENADVLDSEEKLLGRLQMQDFPLI